MKKKREGTLVYWLAAIMIALSFLSVAFNAIGQEAESADTAAAVEPVAVAPASEPATAKNPRIDVVFVLDTTGSMSGLIEGAKRKIWSILNSIASGKPTPDIRVGLVAYRDRKDAYVTQKTDLTDNLDAMYEKLMALKAQGGGDTPESVNQALNEAVTKMSWAEGDDVLKLVFLVGDAPPHMDYEDDVKYPATCKTAAMQAIIINSVQCGSIAGTDKIWKEIADRSEGTFVAISQTGGMKAIATPYDEEIAKLDREWRGTAIHYGSADARHRAKAVEDKTETALAEAPTEALADRALFMSTARKAMPAATAGTDLVVAYEEGSVNLETLDADTLPDEMKNMTEEEKKAFVEKAAKHRAEIQKKLAELNKQRAEFIAKEAKKAAEAGGKKDAFDLKVIESVRKHASKAGIEYE